MKEKEGSNILTEDDIEMVDISESQMDTQIDLTWQQQQTNIEQPLRVKLINKANPTNQPI